MTKEQRASTTSSIISHLRFHVLEHNKALKPYTTKRPKHFDSGEVFLMLCFKSDKELQTIGKLTGI